MNQFTRSVVSAAAFLIAVLGLPLSSIAADSPRAPAAKADYPLTTCVVSDEKLDSAEMGGPVDYIHKEAGKPDRLVRFCCKDCIKDFKQDPAKYLKKLDEAAAPKTVPAPAHKHDHATPAPKS